MPHPKRFLVSFRLYSSKNRAFRRHGNVRFFSIKPVFWLNFYLSERVISGVFTATSAFCADGARGRLKPLAIIASAVGAACKPSQGSCLPCVASSMGLPLMSILRRGVAMELVGLMAILTQMSCPVLMPLRMPPEWLDRKPCWVSSRRVRCRVALRCQSLRRFPAFYGFYGVDRVGDFIAVGRFRVRPGGRGQVGGFRCGAWRFRHAAFAHAVLAVFAARQFGYVVFGSSRILGYVLAALQTDFL